MAKIQAVWAIDIGQAALKALKLVPGESADQVVAEAFDFVEYPKILSQPDADPEELVREALTTFLGRNDLKGAKVAIAVAGQAGLVKFIKLPPVEKKRIPDIVKFEAKQQIPFALEEVIWDYQQIGGDDDGDDTGFTMAEVGLFAMKRDQINRAIQPLKNAGIEVDVVQMGPIALYNYASYDQPRGKEGAEGSIILLDVGADNTDLIITDGTRIWQRNVPIGGNHFTRALTKELKLTFAKAEHLKRNATKAQDPRAVFTAMRGVFNDFAGEISRSVGFYSSVNRQAKIAKVIGLGNGFKLPGLQKFLQQNLNLNVDVERLEAFNKIVGDDVVAAPQFQENLLSFAVAYGLGVQGLGLGPLRTNLLPPEIERVRMVRRKKPWVLAASALLMLGFSSLFIADWNALAKVSNERFTTAVGAAKDAKKQGDEFKSQFDTAKSAFEGELGRGKALVADSAEAASWPVLLRTVNVVVPAPEAVAEAVFKTDVDPNDPEWADVLRDLRIHIDQIKPVYLKDVAADWYSTLDPLTKTRMHALDRTTGPTGEGWIIQLVGHHYNPNPIGANARRLSKREKDIARGPWPYLLEAVLPRFWDPRLRQMGISHATIAGIAIDDDWVTAKGAEAGSPVASLVLPRNGPSPSSGGGMGGMMGMMGGSMGGMMGGAMGGMMGGQMGMMKGMRGMRGGMGEEGMMGMPGAAGRAASKEAPKELKLTRTDFVIQFLWQPPAPDKELKKLEDIQKELADAETKNQGAIKAFSSEELAKFTASSQQTIQKKEQQIVNQLSGAAAGTPAGAGPATGAAAPGTPAPAPAAAPGTPAGSTPATPAPPTPPAGNAPATAPPAAGTTPK